MKTLKNALFLFVTLGMLLMTAACSDIANNPATTPSPSEDNAEETSNVHDQNHDYVDFTMDYSGGINENGYWEGISAYDHLEKFDYLGIEIPYDVYTVSDTAIQSEIDKFLTTFSTTAQITDRAVENGDMVNIDYVGSIDGVEFENGSTEGNGTDVEIGVTLYIDDFLEQLIGHMPGETFDVNATFPEDYGQEELNGKDAVFVTTINYITEPVMPELTDDFVSANLSDYGWDTVDGMTSAIAEALSSTAIAEHIKNYLISTVTVKSIPEFILHYQEDTVVSFYSNYAMSYGLDIESFVSMLMGYENVKALLDSNAAIIKSNAIHLLAAQAIAEDLKLTVTDIDLENYFFDATGSSDYAEYETFYGRGYIAQAALIELVNDYLIDNAVMLSN